MFSIITNLHFATAGRSFLSWGLFLCRRMQRTIPIFGTASNILCREETRRLEKLLNLLLINDDSYVRYCIFWVFWNLLWTVYFTRRQALGTFAKGRSLFWNKTKKSRPVVMKISTVHNKISTCHHGNFNFSISTCYHENKYQLLVKMVFLNSFSAGILWKIPNKEQTRNPTLNCYISKTKANSE